MAGTIEIDEIFAILSPLEKYLRCVFLNFKRNANDRFELRRHILMNCAIVICVLEILAICMTVSQFLTASGQSDLSRLLVVTSFEVMALIRSFGVVGQRKRLASIANDLDAIFPRSADLQRRMRLPHFVGELKVRFRRLHLSTLVGLLCYVCIPIGIFLVTHERGAPMRAEYQVLHKWRPFGLRRSAAAYPLLYVYELVYAMVVLFFLLNWDRVFNIYLMQMRMHFEHLTEELRALRAEESHEPAKAATFLAHWRELVLYEQALNRIGRKVTKAFFSTLFLSNSVAAASICLHLNYFIYRRDLIAILTYGLPCLILVWLTYDVCKRATDLMTASSDVRDGLYSHNWYEGSLEHRKNMLMWMHRLNEPYRLSAYQLIDINMEHFRNVMLLGYNFMTLILALTEN